MEFSRAKISVRGVECNTRSNQNLVNNKLNRSEYGWKIWQFEFDNLNMIFGFSEFFRVGRHSFLRKSAQWNFDRQYRLRPVWYCS